MGHISTKKQKNKVKQNRIKQNKTKQNKKIIIIQHTIYIVIML